ncbi:hypothetical protein MKW94_024527 [Papaver nudicaule]|uniref:Homeobox domain-containing protein n=1 Tax=Papaver nudicaule TaxID=74823 RepID=A0AA41VJ16_PAPNU|nr:hypothetical protein [Papaver nudicaule]
MGRPPSVGPGPSFRFTANEVVEMEACLQKANFTVPSMEVIRSMAEKFSTSAERSGKIAVHQKQVWNWFQNRRYAHKAKTGKPPENMSVTPKSREDLVSIRNVPHIMPVPSGRSTSDNNALMEFEARSSRDGAWYDVAAFISHRMFETGDPEVRVRFAGFGAEEDEWINVRKHVRQRSLPCEASECVAVLAGDLILCFQEGKDQALYYDAHVLDAQRRRHDARGCRCRFLVRYDHDQAEEIVQLRKVCRRPETDYRLRLLHSSREFVRVDPKREMGEKTTSAVNSCSRNYSNSESEKSQGVEVTADGKVKEPSVNVTAVTTGTAVAIKAETSTNCNGNIGNLDNQTTPGSDAVTVMATNSSSNNLNTFINSGSSENEKTASATISASINQNTVATSVDTCAVD